MARAYEVALICDIKSGLSDEVLETLAYMTRERGYAFKASLQHDFFAEDQHQEWRNIISNISGRNAEEHFFESDRRSLLTSKRLCFRRTENELAYLEVVIPLMDWLATVSDTIGQELVGFKTDLTTIDYELIYFAEGETIEKCTDNPDADIPQALRRGINEALGGRGIWT